jgi:hypothetical protein
LANIPHRSLPAQGIGLSLGFARAFGWHDRDTEAIVDPESWGRIKLLGGSCLRSMVDPCAKGARFRVSASKQLSSSGQDASFDNGLHAGQLPNLCLDGT